LKNNIFVVFAQFLSKPVKPLESFGQTSHAHQLSTNLSTDSVDIAITIDPGTQWLGIKPWENYG
jgi:hypothetical protein